VENREGSKVKGDKEGEQVEIREGIEDGNV